MDNKWDIRFLDLALHIAAWSKDPKCKVGALVVSPDRREITPGYNGFPAGFSDTESRLYGSDKNKWMAHAEVNAILNARKDLSGYAVYSSKPPCLECAKAIVQAGIKRVVYINEEDETKWANSHADAYWLFHETGIERCPYNKGEFLRCLTVLNAAATI